MKKRSGLNVVDYYSEKVGDITVAKLYNTFIFIKEENYIKLNSDGFRTRHTKNCINDLLPSGYSLNQIKGKWMVTTPNEVVEFVDDMKLYLS